MSDINEKAMFLVPIVINPNIETITNTSKPVSVSPEVEGVKRENNNPIIVVPGVMGSKLFQNIYSHGEERRFYRTEKKIIKSST